MASARALWVLRATVTVIFALAGLIVLFLMYFKSVPFLNCGPLTDYSLYLGKLAPSHRPSVTKNQTNNTAGTPETDKPILLLWFWPENKKFDFKDCKKIFKIDSCHLTDDRDLYFNAQAVLVFHRAIQNNLSNLPSTPRAKFQRWIWFNMDSPNNTRKIEGIQGLFNLTMSYRADADIHVRWRLTAKMNTDVKFVLPKKERLLCWIVDRNGLDTKPGVSYSYYRELVKHIKVDIFHSSSDDRLKGEKYFQTISSCKFYLSFEDSIYKDYITETFNGPLAAGTVPVVLGPPRRNYEQFVPGSSFIHVNDFKDAAALAEFLLKLDKDNELYMRYFDWKQFYTTRRHLTEEKHEFTHAICQACRYVGLRKEYRFVPDVYKWFFL